MTLLTREGVFCEDSPYVNLNYNQQAETFLDLLIYTGAFAPAHKLSANLYDAVPPLPR